MAIIPAAFDTTIGELRKNSGLIAKIDELETRIVLERVRVCIYRFFLDNGGTYPAADEQQTTFESDITPYVLPFSTSSLPTSKIGALNNLIRFQHMTGPPWTPEGDTSPTKGWTYDWETGVFLINYSATNADGTRYDKM